MGRFGAIALAVLALAACGELPRPFRPDTVPDLARPRLVRAVAVRPIDGLPAAPALAEALVKAFGDLDVPALVRDDIPGALRLQGHLDASAGAVDWVLLGVDRQPLAGFRQTLSPSVLAGSGGAKALAGVAAQAVVALTVAAAPLPDAPAVAGPMPPPADAAPRRPVARILPIAALPGDGAKALERNLRTALERSGIIVVTDGGDYVVEGRIEVGPGAPGQQILKVAWVVGRPDGGPLGTIDQQGAVAKGSLDGAWGGLARDIAEGGAVGIVQVIDAAYRNAQTGRAGGRSSLQN